MVEKTPAQEIIQRISQKVPPNITLTSFLLVMDPAKQEKPAENKAKERKKQQKRRPAPKTVPSQKGREHPTERDSLRGW